jgi:hypothetical protein
LNFLSPSVTPLTESSRTVALPPAAATRVGSQFFPREQLLEIRSRLDFPGQRISAGTRTAPSQPVSFSERKGDAPPSGHWFSHRAVVAGVNDNRVVGDLEIVELLEQFAHLPVMLGHAVGLRSQAGLPPSKPV